jgi:hypothetical protein
LTIQMCKYFTSAPVKIKRKSNASKHAYFNNAGQITKK